MTNNPKPPKYIDDLNKILWYNFQDSCTAEDVEEAKAQINNYIKEQMLSLINSSAYTIDNGIEACDAYELRSAINERFK